MFYRCSYALTKGIYIHDVKFHGQVVGDSYICMYDKHRPYKREGNSKLLPVENKSPRNIYG